MFQNDKNIALVEETLSTHFAKKRDKNALKASINRRNIVHTPYEKMRVGKIGKKDKKSPSSLEEEGLIR